jgi:two-component system, NarL family, sensor kinase
MNPNTLKDDQIIELTIYTCLAFLLLASILITFFYFSRKKIVKIELDSKNFEIFNQKELANAVLLMQEEERKRIAQNLHDDISSKLNIISINTHLLQNEDITETERIEITNTIINYTKLVSDDSRRIAHDLLPPILQNFGLHAGIEELCNELSNSKSLNIEYENQVQFDNTFNNKHLHVFRILQELINNSIKHGKAKNISIKFTKNTNKTTTLNYNDDGIGFDPENLKSQKGLGMKNIESRINFLDATMTYNSKKNQYSNFIIDFEL